MLTIEDKLQRVAIINKNDLERVKRGFTGHVTIHWVDGCPREEEIFVRKHITPFSKCPSSNNDNIATRSG